MITFKKGDRVEYTAHNSYLGKTGTVVHDFVGGWRDDVRVNWDHRLHNDGGSAWASNLKPLPPEPLPEYRVGDTVKVTVEGKVLQANHGALVVDSPTGPRSFSDAHVTVERVLPAEPKINAVVLLQNVTTNEFYSVKHTLRGWEWASNEPYLHLIHDWAKIAGSKGMRIVSVHGE